MRGNLLKDVDELWKKIVMITYKLYLKKNYISQVFHNKLDKFRRDKNICVKKIK